MDAGGGERLRAAWLNAPTFISQTTVHSFVDIGYVAALSIGAMSLGAIPSAEAAL
jgi:hypothetical protein